MKAVAIIPARFDSSRFPGKPLAKLGSKTIIQHVYDRTLETGLFESVIVGTDDQRIFEEVDAFGGIVTLTSKAHSSGSDRIAEVCRKMVCCQNADVIVNVQGDEPFISIAPLTKLVSSFADDNVKVASLMHRLKTQISNVNNVKVVCDKAGFALYFSRSVIPFDRDKTTNPEVEYFKHIGVYAFRRDVLFKFVDLPESKLEQIEKLEQLRLLENGIPIKMIETEYKGIGIDTPQDLELARKMLKL